MKKGFFALGGPFNPFSEKIRPLFPGPKTPGGERPPRGPWAPPKGFVSQSGGGGPPGQGTHPGAPRVWGAPQKGGGPPPGGGGPGQEKGGRGVLGVWGKGDPGSNSPGRVFSLGPPPPPRGGKLGKILHYPKKKNVWGFRVVRILRVGPNF